MPNIKPKELRQFDWVSLPPKIHGSAAVLKKQIGGEGRKTWSPAAIVPVLPRASLRRRQPEIGS
jgi:hypothetical protein